MCFTQVPGLGDKTAGQSHTALVAQRIRASDYGSEGWGFESLRARRISPGQSVTGRSRQTLVVPLVVPLDISWGHQVSEAIWGLLGR
jgi:hypothetical protein